MHEDSLRETAGVVGQFGPYTAGLLFIGVAGFLLAKILTPKQKPGSAPFVDKRHNTERGTTEIRPLKPDNSWHNQID